jgi:hypothetical protein
MSPVPRWFSVLANGFAVAFAFCLGLHSYSHAEWLVIFAAMAGISAVLPYVRVVAFAGLAGGIVIAVVGTYFIRASWHTAAPLPGRDAVVLVIGCLWLVVGSAFRLQQA